jgi:glycosyltransferase involved in cell wall biosynthesis
VGNPTPLPLPGSRPASEEPHRSGQKAFGGSAASRPRLCFVAPNAYAALTGRSDLRHIGGAEMQQVTVARGLSRRLDVSFVVSDHAQEDGECSEGGVTVFKASAKGHGLRSRYLRLTGLWRALRRADADVYYQRMAETTTGIVGAFCRHHGRKFIFATAAQYDCLRLPRPYRTRREEWLYRYGLRRADRIFVQTLHQQELMRRNFGHESVVVRNCGIPIQDTEGVVSRTDGPEDPPRVLWIGRCSLEKRPLLAIEVAARCPSAIFDVIGDGDDAALKARIRERTAETPNVLLHGYVPHTGMAAFYRKADLLLCTSEQEGFPNVFLEAFSCGIPVVSTVDPDDLIASHGLGRIRSSAEELAAAVRSLTQDRAAWSECSRRGQAYYRSHHDPAVVLPEYVRHVAELLAESGRVLS